MKAGFLTRNIPAAFDRRWLPKALLASPFAFAAAFGTPQASAQIATGTVMVSTGNGRVTEFTQTGTVITQIDTTTGSADTTGSAFDSVGNFFVTDFEAQMLSKFDPTGFLVNPNFAGPFNLDPESIVFDAAGDFYVGQADGAQTILKFDPSGTLLATFAPLTGPRGTDWTELEADQCTLVYTSEGTDVRTFNACTNTQGPNFNKLSLPGPFAYAHRLLPTGGMLVADTDRVVRLDASGNQIQTYTLPVSGQLFALNLDPDGTSFWTAELGGSNHVFKLDIASGTVLQNFDASVAPNFNEVGGLSVKGEIVVSNPGPCGSGDAALVNVVFPAPGTLTYDISSPTRTLSSIKLAASTNIGSFTLPAIQPGGHSATGGSFVKADSTKNATFELQANFAGPAFACLIDPIITTLKIKAGHTAEQAFHMIPKAEHFIDVENGTPGLKSLRIDVNGRFLRTVSLRSGGAVHTDASSAMTLANNTLKFIGEGKAGSFANIDVSDSAPKSAKVSQNGTSIQDKGIWGRLMYKK